MFTMKFTVVHSKKRNKNVALVTKSGDTFFITFSGNRIFQYRGVNPKHVLGRVIRVDPPPKTADLRGTYVVMRGHTIFSLGLDDRDIIDDLIDNPELVASVDSIATFRQFLKL